MAVYRVGGHWRVTVIEVGFGEPDAIGRRVGDRLIACAQSPADAQLIADALNAFWGRRPDIRPGDAPSPKVDLE